MRTKTDQMRQRIIDSAYESFWRAGFTRTSLDTIAERAGVTKRTLYSYFRSKDDLLATVLLRYGELAAQRLKRIGERMPTDGDAMVGSFFEQLAGWATTAPRWSGSGFTRLVVELADLPGHPARALARRHKTATESWLAQRLAKARIRQPRRGARELMLLMEGAMVLMLVHSDRRYIDAAAQAAMKLLQKSQVPVRR